MSKTKEVTFTCGEFRAIPSRYNVLTLHVEDPNTDELLTGISDTDIAAYVSANMEVDAVFSDEQLEKWAEDNGYVKQ